MDVRAITVSRTGRCCRGMARLATGLLAAVPLLACLLPSAAALAQSMPLRVDEQQVVTLYGNTPRWADPGRVVGIVAPEVRLQRMVLVLRADAGREQALRQFVQRQHEPGAAEFHHWLTPAEFGRRFGATASELALVTGWLRSHGFSVEPVSAGQRLVVFSGTEAAVEDAFHVALRRYAVARAVRVANGEDPQIPQALAGVVRGVLSLSQPLSQSQIAQQVPITLPGLPGAGQTGAAGAGSAPPRLHPLYTQGTTHYLFPADFATIYDANPVYAQGINGAGAGIAVLGRSDVSLADIAEFRSFANLAGGPTVEVTIDGPDPGFVGGDQSEGTLDLEWAGAVAPQAQVSYVEAASTATTDGVDLAAAYAVNHRLASVLSLSYANCEQSMGATELAFYDDLWTQAASEGISVFASAGDAGAAGCNAGGDTSGSSRAVSGMCTPIWATCVGGTEFDEGDYTYWNPYNGPGSESALGYIPEVVWNESGANGGSGLWASGGGVSTAYTQPPWQAAVAGGSGGGMRTVPDVSVSTAQHDGYLGCVGGSWFVFSGTSLSAPAWAGLLALVNQSQSATGAGSGQGSANPELYALVNAAASPFHNTRTGNNTVPGVNGYSASGGYNLATGLGSVDAAALVAGWAFNAEGLAQSFVLTPSQTSVTVIDGSQTSLTLAATSVTGSTGVITLTASAPPGVTVTFQPSAISPGQSTTMTVAAAANAPTGTGSILVTGVSGAARQTVTLALTVEPAPALAVSAASQTLVLTQGASAGTAITVTSGGTFSGAAMLSVSGLPAGVTAVWSRTTLTPPGAATLTLVAAANAAPVSGVRVTVAATGDGVTATAGITLSVLAAQSELDIVAANGSLRLLTGGQLTLPVTVTAASGFAGLVRVGVAGLPTGVTAAWSATRFEAAGPATIHLTLTLRATATAATVSDAPLTLSAFGNGQTAYGAASLTVALPTAITLALSENPLSLTPGTSVPVTATVRIVGPLTLAANLSDVALRMAGQPAGVTASWSGITRAGNGLLTAQGTVTASASAVGGVTRGVLLAEVTDVASGIVYDGVEPVELDVHPQATLTVAATAAGVMLLPGQTASIPVTVASSAPPGQPVRLSVEHLPAGVTAAWSENPIANPGTGTTVTLRLSVAASARPATGILLLNAAGDGLAAQTTLGYRLY